MTQMELLTPANDVRYHPDFSDLEPNIVEQFFKFHNENPGIYMLFQRFAYEIKQSGKKKYGAKVLAERCRWHVEIEKRGEFKVNNNYTSCYARLLMIRNPDFKNFFDTRSSQ